MLIYKRVIHLKISILISIASLLLLTKVAAWKSCMNAPASRNPLVLNNFLEQISISSKLVAFVACPLETLDSPLTPHLTVLCYPWIVRMTLLTFHSPWMTKMTLTKKLPSHDLPLHDITKPEPTIPGVFRKTSDPFGTMGNMMSMIDRRSKTMALGSSGSMEVETEALRPIQSALKLSLSDGELNTLDNGNSPSMSQATPSPSLNNGGSLSGLPPPPLDI